MLTKPNNYFRKFISVKTVKLKFLMHPLILQVTFREIFTMQFHAKEKKNLFVCKLINIITHEAKTLCPFLSKLHPWRSVKFDIAKV